MTSHDKETEDLGEARAKKIQGGRVSGRAGKPGF